MATINKAAAAHKASLTPVPNQMALGNDPKYRVCCKNARHVENGVNGKNETMDDVPSLLSCMNGSVAD